MTCDVSLSFTEKLFLNQRFYQTLYKGVRFLLKEEKRKRAFSRPTLLIMSTKLVSSRSFTLPLQILMKIWFYAL